VPVYIQIIEILKKQGHTVVSEHVAYVDLEKREAKISDEEIFNNDIGYIDECECLVADCNNTFSWRRLRDMLCVSKGKNVLCVYRDDANVSACAGQQMDFVGPIQGYEDLKRA